MRGQSVAPPPQRSPAPAGRLVPIVLVNTPRPRATPTNRATPESAAVTMPDLDDLPDYMQKAVEFFRDDISADPRWDALVAAWMTFEGAMGLHNRDGRVRNLIV